MRKPRNDSHWANLTPEQSETLDQWLFTEHLIYPDVVKRAKAEFGIDASEMSVSRYYQRRARERQLEDLTQAQELSDAVGAADWNIDLMRSAAVKLLAKTALNMACREPEKLTELGSLMRLLLISENNDLRRERIQLRREHYGEQLQATASKELPDLARFLSKIENDNALTEDMKVAKIKAMLYPVSGPKSKETEVSEQASNVS